MTATKDEHGFLVVALVLALFAAVVLLGDKLTHPHIAHRQTFDLWQLVFSTIALLSGVVVLVQMRRRRPAVDEPVIDLRERLTGFVDLDDVEVDRAMHVR
jgi:hypothetical protein